MAYNADNEKQVEYGMVPRNDRGEYVKVSRVIPKLAGRLESLDIRLMWTNDAGSILPSQKGVRIHTEMLTDVMVAVIKAMTPEEREDLQAALVTAGIDFDASGEYDDEEGSDGFEDQELTEQNDI